VNTDYIFDLDGDENGEDHPLHHPLFSVDSRSCGESSARIHQIPLMCCRQLDAFHQVSYIYLSLFLLLNSKTATLVLQTFTSTLSHAMFHHQTACRSLPLSHWQTFQRRQSLLLTTTRVQLSESCWRGKQKRRGLVINLYLRKEQKFVPVGQKLVGVFCPDNTYTQLLLTFFVVSSHGTEEHCRPFHIQLRQKCFYRNTSLFPFPACRLQTASVNCGSPRFAAALYFGKSCFEI
jgi:hypothetical protein